jgi:anti-anti-sigma factor
MMASPVTTRVESDGTAVVAPVGEIDLDNAYRIREAVDAALLGRKPAKIVIDLGAVSLIDTVGIGAMVASYHDAAASGVALVAAHPSATVYRQLWISGLVGLFGLATPSAESEPAAA